MRMRGYVLYGLMGALALGGLAYAADGEGWWDTIAYALSRGY